MSDSELERRQVVTRTLEETFDFFANPHNLAAITPPWLSFRIVEAPERLGPRALLRYRLSVLGVPVDWRTEIADWRPPRSFTDVQVAGPYRLWIHTHRFASVDGGTEIYDHVRYRVPGGPLAPLVHAAFVRPRLEEIFAFRARRLAELLR